MISKGSLPYVEEMYAAPTSRDGPFGPFGPFIPTR